MSVLYDLVNTTYLYTYSLSADFCTYTLLGAAAGSPYIVFKLTFSYGFMLRIYIYIYIYIYI